MKQRKKSYRVEFFGDHIRPPIRRYKSGSAILGGIKAGNIPPRPVVVGSHLVGLRELELVGPAYQGIIGNFRQENLPKIGKLDDSLVAPEEHDIPMKDNEGLIEKTHFVLYRRPPLLLMQLNNEGPGVATLARYLKEVSGEDVIFPPVLRREAYERMLRDDLKVKDIDIKIARPLGVDALKKGFENDPGIEFTKALLRLMDSNNAATLTLTMKASMLKQNRWRTLSSNIKAGLSAALNNFSGTTMLERAKLKMEDPHGKVHPVDLIEDRLFTKISVEMEGRYPNMTSMFREIIRSKDAEEEGLRAFFQEQQ